MERFKPFRALAQCYADALLREGEAIARYQEFAEIAQHQGEETVARLFGELARSHFQRIATLARQAEDLELPQLDPRQYGWLDDGRPDPDSQGMAPYPSSPRDALGIALAAEKRVKEFFESLVRQAEHRDARRLGAQIVKEQLKHIAELKTALHQTPTRPKPEVYGETYANGPR